MDGPLSFRPSVLLISVTAGQETLPSVCAPPDAAGVVLPLADPPLLADPPPQPDSARPQAIANPQAAATTE